MYLRVCWSIAACLHTSGLRSPEFKRGSELQLSVHHYLMVTDGKEAEEALCYTGIFVAPYSYHRHHFSPLASPGSDPWWMLTERVSHHLISTNTPDQGQTTHKHEDRERDRVDTSNKKGGSNLGQIRPEFKLLIKSAYAAGRCGQWRVWLYKWPSFLNDHWSQERWSWDQEYQISKWCVSKIKCVAS